MKCNISDNLKYVMILIVGLSIVLQTSIALSAQVNRKDTKILPGQPATPATTIPIQSTTPSMKYQTIKKPSVKRLDIPDYDIAAELRIVNAESHGVGVTRIHYQLKLMNKGKRNIGTRRIQIRIRVINDLTQTLFQESHVVWGGPNVRNDYWTVENRNSYIYVRHAYQGSPNTIDDVKVIMDIDPHNIFGEAQRHRGNNRCVVIW